jgi:hypothetical protein
MQEKAGHEHTRILPLPLTRCRPEAAQPSTACPGSWTVGLRDLSRNLHGESEQAIIPTPELAP